MGIQDDKDEKNLEEKGLSLSLLLSIVVRDYIQE